jgi:hypothetical protein
VSALKFIRQFADEQSSSWVIVGGELFDAASRECGATAGCDVFAHGGLRIYDGRVYHLGNVPEDTTP